MRLSPALKIGVLTSAICLCVHGQNAPAKDGQTETRGMPPRTTPGDYQAHAQAGAVTIAAEFDGHSVPTQQKTLSTEEFVAIETALYGPPGTRIKLSPDDFALRINGRKAPLPSQQYGLVVGSLRDPEWVPPEQAAAKSSKGGITTGGEGGQGADSGPPPPVKIPVELQRAMAQQAQKASLPEGDRALPQAGLLFFPYRGKTDKIRSIELIYTGPAGKATVTLQP
jgi:hypothetical protein